MAQLHGKSIIAGKRSSPGGDTFHAFSPLDDNPLPGDFQTASLDEVSLALEAARDAFPAFRASSGESRAVFLETIAGNLIALGDELITRARLETGLSEKRLHSELARTTGHLRMFAEIARTGSWRDEREVPADPLRTPLPRPSLRRHFQPIGPVVVFGSSNFPLAYSVAGGDTASALATGNPVVVKAHEAHPGTSELVAGAIVSAASSSGLPSGIFSLLQGDGRKLGVPLVKHPATRAVGFTGSTRAGRILIDAAATRPDPIPVFAEMGSLNPVAILPSSLDDPDRIAGLLVPSITNDAGQFCTKPGVILIPDTPDTDTLISRFITKWNDVLPVPMLHRGIHRTFVEGVKTLSSHPGITLLASKATTSGPLEGPPHLFKTTAENFLSDETLRHEYFGPLSILVTCATDQISTILRTIGGQITASVFSNPADPVLHDLIPLLSETAGRVIFNGVPTGVEVNEASNHGGPWPACSDSRFTAVGPEALLRFIRPVAWQNFPEELDQRTVG